MDTLSALDKLRDAEFNNASLYILFDGALIPAMQMAYENEGSPNVCPIYYGTRHEGAVEVSPCLYQPADKSRIWEQEETWRSKAVLLTSACSFFDVLHHLKSLISVTLDSEQMAYWRFYSPEFLTSIMNTFDAGKLREFTGLISQWAAYTESGWEIYRPPLAEEPVLHKKEGWLRVSNNEMAVWKAEKENSYLNRLESKLKAKLGVSGVEEEKRLRKEMSYWFDFAKSSGFKSVSELERFVLFCLKNPDAVGSKKCAEIITDKNLSPTLRLDKIEATVFGLWYEEEL